MLRVSGVTKTFDGGPRALDGFDLELAQGRIATLVGPSGCGKTTALRCIAGLETPEAGTIEVAGRMLFGPSKHVPAESRGLGLVAQSFALWPHMTVARTVAFPLEVVPRGRRLARREIAERVERTLTVVRLDGLADRLPRELSGGQQQRLALARALAVEPPLLLMDEPFSSLDAPLREELRTELKRLQADLGITAVFVTHDRIEALAIGNDCVVLREGRVEQSGRAREVYERPATPFVAGFVARATLLAGEGCADGSVATAAGPVRGAAAAAEGARVTVAVRAEDVRLAEDAEGAGTVRTRSFHGETVEHLVDVGGIELRAHTPTDVSIRPGTRVAVTFAERSPAVWAGDPASTVF
jgi:iron(III) transport system ATP-binding protein